MNAGSSSKHAVRARHWTAICVCLLAVLLPLQGLSLAMNQYLKPAHYHLPTWSKAAPEAAMTPARDDLVLERLDATAGFGSRVASTTIDYHTHAPGNPGVVYVDDDGSSGKGASFAKSTVDTVAMQLPDWPLVLPTRARDVGIAMTAVASPIWRTFPPERPPSRPMRLARSA